MSENFLGVLESLGHLCIFAIKSGCQRIITSLSFQVDVSYQLLFTWQNDFSLVCKVNLNNFVAESEHYSVFSLHPFLDIAISIIRCSIFIEINFVVSIQVISKMLKKGNFFLKLSFSRIITDLIRCNCISLVSLFLLNIFKIISIFVNDDLSWIIEIDSCWSIWK